MTKEIISGALKLAFEAQVLLLFRNLCDGIGQEQDSPPMEGNDARRRFINGLDLACLAFEEMSQRPS